MGFRYPYRYLCRFHVGSASRHIAKKFMLSDVLQFIFSSRLGNFGKGRLKSGYVDIRLLQRSVSLLMTDGFWQGRIKGSQFFVLRLKLIADFKRKEISYSQDTLIDCSWFATLHKTENTFAAAADWIRLSCSNSTRQRCRIFFEIYKDFLFVSGKFSLE